MRHAAWIVLLLGLGLVWALWSWPEQEPAGVPSGTPPNELGRAAPADAVIRGEAVKL